MEHGFSDDNSKPMVALAVLIALFVTIILYAIQSIGDEGVAIGKVDIDFNLIHEANRLLTLAAASTVEDGSAVKRYAVTPDRNGWLFVLSLIEKCKQNPKDWAFLVALLKPRGEIQGRGKDLVQAASEELGNGAVSDAQLKRFCDLFAGHVSERAHKYGYQIS